MEDKFKEFWIVEGKGYRAYTNEIEAKENADKQNAVYSELGAHVIQVFEKSALESANAEISKLQSEWQSMRNELRDKLYGDFIVNENKKLSEQLESANAELKQAIDARDYWQLRASKSKMEKLESENKKLSDAISEINQALLNCHDENAKLRAALEEIVTLSTYAGKITKDIEHYMTMRIASRAPEIAREALEKLNE